MICHNGKIKLALKHAYTRHSQGKLHDDVYHVHSQHKEASQPWKTPVNLQHILEYSFGGECKKSHCPSVSATSEVPE